MAYIELQLENVAPITIGGKNVAQLAKGFFLFFFFYIAVPNSYSKLYTFVCMHETNIFSC